MIVQLDTENADRDLTSQVTVLTHTPNASHPMWCEGHIYLGDGAKDLDGTGGDFELTISIGGNIGQPDPQTIAFSTAVRGFIQTWPFAVPANAEVILKVKSPNGADTDVDVTAYLYQVDAVDAVAWNSVKLSTTNPLPNADADAAGGLPISDAGGLDLDTKLANTNEVTTARMGALTDWIDGGRLDLLLDAIKAVTDNLPNSGALTDLATAAALATVDTVVDAIKAVTDNLPNSGALSDIDTGVDAVEAMVGTTGMKIDEGTGSGQLSSSSGVVKSNLTQISDSATVDTLALTEIFEILIALAHGDVAVSTSGTDIILTYKKQNGSDTMFVHTVDTDGNRAVT